MTKRNRTVIILIAIMVATLLLACLPGSALAARGKTGPTTLFGDVTFTSTTTYPYGVIIAEGCNIGTPLGYSVTMTVNGVETGQRLETTKGTNTVFVPGSYPGKVVFTVTEWTILEFVAPGPPGPPAQYFTRQALYVDETGVVIAKSVPSALVGGTVSDTQAKNVKITSNGEVFNGVLVAGGYYLLKNIKMDMVSDGRMDFVGYGAAILATGADTKLVVDGAKVHTDGVVRTGVVADEGANVVVKNSTIQTNDGVLPADYEPTMNQLYMMSVPWVLGLSGNCRATNLCGTNTIASYINSYISAEGWGVLSTDDCTTPQLNAINSTIEITGPDGYGSYGIGGATERFLGCTLNVATYATISRGSTLYYDDSDKATVRQLNTDCEMGLSAAELNALRVKKTVVNSDRFGIMWHGGGDAYIGGGTVFNTGETTFLNKGQAHTVNVDGSEGAKLNPGNGIIYQLIDDDDPGAVMPAGVFSAPYVEPAGPAVPDATHDIYTAGANDAWANFENIAVEGDFYNGALGGIKAGGFGPPSSVSRNLVVSFDDAFVTGMITSSYATHAPYTTIQPPYFYAYAVPGDYKHLGEVTNTPQPAVNNGVFVVLYDNSRWMPTGTCYLTGLYIGGNARVLGWMGRPLTMTVDGVETPIVPGQYTGDIVIGYDLSI